MPQIRTHCSPLKVGRGLIGVYTKGPGATLRFEGPRPGPGWHRHDWRPRHLPVVDAAGVHHVVIDRRRWRLHGTTTTRLDHAPDEVVFAHSTLVVVFLALCAWLLSADGLHRHASHPASLEGVACLRTVHRWLHRLLPDAARVQEALRTAVVERSEPQPVERLFPGGLSPPVAVRRRRWKDPEATYRLVTGLAFLALGADALTTSATTLLAEAHLGDAGTLGTSRR
ncbi:hypothetical protein LBMAG42_34320 [Deltaproteobacteria bacterium]|nr:hypothetical protein LBMAG42_34320 [Deltaproteobacteria bacterium]